MNTKIKPTVAVTIIVALALISIAVLEPIFSNNDTVITNSYASYEDIVTDIPHNYLIEDVPYVGQETSFYCAYASLTMIFQYYSRDTTLYEILYCSGVGYSFAHIGSTPLLYGGYALSQAHDDMEFLADLFGFSFYIWAPYNNFMSDDERWDQYWSIMKQNISDGIPVETSVNPFSLPSLRQQFDVSDDTWSGLSSSGHAIVIVGYNETNETICYNDPAAEYFGRARYGHYAWMDLKTFREAIKGNLGIRYLIITFEEALESLPKSEIYKRAHERNTKRLRGSHDAYDEMLTEVGYYEFGISGSKSLKKDFSRGLNNRIKTIFIYKIMGKQFRKQKRQDLAKSLLYKIPQSFFQIIHPTENEFDRIAIEKCHTAKYLTTMGNSHEAGLFEQEAEHWSKLSSFYNKYLKRGFVIFLPHSILIMRQMENIVDEIISTEESIITSSA